jgi:hypothetical protein
MLDMRSVTELVETRRAILDSFGDNDSEATDLANMNRLYPVEDMIAAAAFESDTDKLSGLNILLESVRWDNFQESLFLRMQEFA